MLTLNGDTDGKICGSSISVTLALANLYQRTMLKLPVSHTSHFSTSWYVPPLSVSLAYCLVAPANVYTKITMGRVIRNQRKGRGSIFSKFHCAIDLTRSLLNHLRSGPYPSQQSASSISNT